MELQKINSKSISKIIKRIDLADLEVKKDINFEMTIKILKELDDIVRKYKHIDIIGLKSIHFLTIPIYVIVIFAKSNLY